MSSTQQHEGKVKWFNGSKGYGFILSDEGDDLFVHFSEIQMEGYKVLNEGDRVAFSVTRGSKGLQAVGVSLL